MGYRWIIYWDENSRYLLEKLPAIYPFKIFIIMS